ncbi:hypothetical protein [Streptomyces sp. NBC_00878]|uniref:hypothetical protein n=1 Tax=Streptomyces sp. NBC_00878 TaxID=2975854 RepID=UPI002259BA99|nr:hypothetical protein [Streptomyces sp. NBC_00878]MCX4906908.1 hypothetical protein [Streptomyces sp. NBC_00878]
MRNSKVRRSKLRPIRSRNVIAGAAVLFLAATVGCTGGSSASSGEKNRSGSTPVLVSSVDLDLPLGAYLLTPRQVNDLSQAHSKLVERCMARLGFDNATTEPEELKAPMGLRSLNERRYGLTNAEEAADLGYRLGDRDPAAQPQREPGKWSPAQADALTGEGAATVNGRPVPRGGCVGEAQRELRADSPELTDRDLAQRLSTDSYNRSRQDSRVHDVIGEWSACMAKRGFHYADPFEATRDPRFRGALSAAEISTATADVSCKRETNLVGVWSTVESSFQRSLVKKHHDKLQRLRRANQTESAAARTVLRR